MTKPYRSVVPSRPAWPTTPRYRDPDTSAPPVAWHAEVMSVDRRPGVLRWRPGRGDVIAGLSVAVLLVPQALAYAEIAGVPAQVGLYAAAAAPIAAAAIASSRYLQTGPTAMTALLTFGALTALADPGTDGYLELAVMLALMVGAVRVAFGLLGAGAVSYLLSQPALLGFTSAAAVLIVASQIPTLLGVVPDDGGLLRRAWEALIDPGSWDGTGIAVGALTAVVVVGGRLFHRLFPGVVVAVVGALVFSEVSGFDGLVVGDVPAGLPDLTTGFPWSSIPDLVIPAVAIALVGFAEPAAIARTFAAQDRERWDPNREFVGQGLANVASAVVGGFPVGGSFSRTSLNRLAGGRTPWSGAITGVAVLAFLPFVSVLEALPRAVLAAVVIVAVTRIVRLDAMVRLIGVSWGQSVVAWGTFAATIALSPRIDLGVIVGIVLGVGFHLRREMRIRVRTEYAGTTLTLRPSGVLYFGSAPQLDQTLTDTLAEHPATERVVVDLTELGRVDYTGAMVLREFTEACEAAGLAVGVSGIPAHARGTFDRSWGDAVPRIRWED